MTPPVTRPALDARLAEHCQVLGCLHQDHALALQPACHPRAHVQAWYVGQGILVLTCGRCGKSVLRVAVHTPDAALTLAVVP